MIYYILYRFAQFLAETLPLKVNYCIAEVTAAIFMFFQKQEKEYVRENLIAVEKGHGFHIFVLTGKIRQVGGSVKR